MIFRIDDICMNTNMVKVNEFVDVIRHHIPYDVTIWCCISPLIHSNAEGERVFPKVFKAMSNHKVHYEVDVLGIPQIPNGCIHANHGLLHVDHRLLGYEGQEMSIVTSAHLTKSNIFVPPFHKWNKDTELICKENRIALIKFEDGWKHILHNKYEPDDKFARWYFHSFDLESPAKLVEWFENSKK